MKLKEALRNKLSEKQLVLVPSTFDIIGDIAVIEIPKSLVKKEKLIANALLGIHKNVKVVVKKAGIHKGRFRLQKYKILAGEKRKKTEYRESGVRLKLNIEKVYFSSRLASERLRIAKQVKESEKILVMFCGIGVYPIVIKKAQQNVRLVGVELNPDAVHYAQENLRLNRACDIEIYKGDVKKIVPKLGIHFDRIIMPFPKGAGAYLDVALAAAKKGAIVHFYDFSGESEIPEGSIKKIKKKIKNFKVLRVVKCGQYSPGVSRVCVDFRIV